MTVFEKIEAQQKGKENTDVWMVGEQLKDICRREPACEGILYTDLGTKGISLADAAAKIRAYSDKNRGSQKCFCVPPNVAEKILREFYGLPDAGAVVPAEPAQDAQSFMSLDLAEYL